MPQGAQGGVEAQATFTPINCNLTQPPICQPQITHQPVCSIATPICGGPIGTRVTPLCPQPPLSLLVVQCPTRVTPLCHPTPLCPQPTITLATPCLHTPITLGACPTFGACPSIACTPGLPQQPNVLGAQAAQVDPQATWTPVNCNITVASLCTPVCGAAAMPQGAQGGVEAQATFTPINCNLTQPPGCPPPFTRQPCSIATPICGGPIVTQVPQLCPQPPVSLLLVQCPPRATPLCTHIPPLCPRPTFATPCVHAPITLGGCPVVSAVACPTFGACPSIACTPDLFQQPNVLGAQAGQLDPQATWTPVNCNITVATLCTPVCGQAAGGQAAAMPQGMAPQATLGPVQCNITIFSICTPVCG